MLHQPVQILRSLSRWIPALSGVGPGSHDAPALEATMPSTVAGRPLVVWSVAGDRFWAGAGRGARSTLGPELEEAGLDPDAIALAVAGRANTGDPPYIVWALQFGDRDGNNLPRPAIALATDVMRVDTSQGDNWRDAIIEGRKVLVGNAQMVRQSEHHRGKPYMCFGRLGVYMFITDDDAWATEVVTRLLSHETEASSRPTVEWLLEFGREAIAESTDELASAIKDFLNKFPFDRGLRDRRQYVLHVSPFGKRMHDVNIELSPPDGTVLKATIPAGQPASRRAPLTTIGWVLEPSDTGTRYYTKRFTISPETPMDVANAVNQTNWTLYGDRAKEAHWAVRVRPQYLASES